MGHKKPPTHSFLSSCRPPQTQATSPIFSDIGMLIIIPTPLLVVTTVAITMRFPTQGTVIIIFIISSSRSLWSLHLSTQSDADGIAGHAAHIPVPRQFCDALVPSQVFVRVGMLLLGHQGLAPAKSSSLDTHTYTGRLITSNTKPARLTHTQKLRRYLSVCAVCRLKLLFLASTECSASSGCFPSSSPPPLLLPVMLRHGGKDGSSSSGSGKGTRSFPAPSSSSPSSSSLAGRAWPLFQPPRLPQAMVAPLGNGTLGWVRRMEGGGGCRKLIRTLLTFPSLY